MLPLEDRVGAVVALGRRHRHGIHARAGACKYLPLQHSSRVGLRAEAFLDDSDQAGDGTAGGAATAEWMRSTS